MWPSEIFDGGMGEPHPWCHGGPLVIANIIDGLGPQVASPILEAALPLLAKLRRPQLLLDRRRPKRLEDGMRIRIWILPAMHVCVDDIVDNMAYTCKFYCLWIHMCIYYTIYTFAITYTRTHTHTHMYIYTHIYTYIYMYIQYIDIDIDIDIVVCMYM